MEAETWDASVGAQRPRHTGGPSRLGARWYITRSFAAVVGATGWLCFAFAGIITAVGAYLIKWARDLHRIADEIRYEA